MKNTRGKASQDNIHRERRNDKNGPSENNNKKQENSSKKKGEKWTKDSSTGVFVRK